MESRFKSRFWPSRRAKPERVKSVCDLSLQGLSYDSVSPNAKPPTFVLPSISPHPAVSDPAGAQSTTDSPHAFCYNKTKAGKAPTFGGRPIKGNGPVKLQTSQAGKWMEASSHSDQVWGEILEGEYVQPSKPTMLSRFKSTRTAPQKSATSQVRLSSIPAPKPLGASASPPTRASCVPSPLLGIPEHSAVADDLGTPSSYANQSPLLCKSSASGLAINDAPSAPAGILKNSSRLSLTEPRDGQNPTIRALWKAESSRLHSLYGQAAEYNSSEPRRASGKPSIDSPILEAVPEPGDDCPDSSINLSLSRADNGHLDDMSEVSSRRLSHVSSTGISSHTSSTTITEVDSYASRADIHKMVEDMRAVYLQALETRESPLHSAKSNRRSKRKVKSLTPSVTPRYSSSMRRSSRTTETKSEVDTMGAEKLASQPHSLSRIHSLHYPDMSDAQIGSLDAGLNRTESGTFGVDYRPDSQRSSVRKRKSQRHSRQASKPCTPPSPGMPSFMVERGNPESDVFQLAIHPFWQPSPDLASTKTTTTTTSTSTPPTYQPNFI